jgi:predicted SpoU family rRNA methylase
MTKMDTMSAFEGSNTTIEKPKTRQQKIDEWRQIHAAEYGRTCHDVQCTCTPSRAQALIIAAYENPPID